MSSQPMWQPGGNYDSKSWCNLALRAQGNGWRIVAEGLRHVQIQDCTSNENQLRVVLEQSAIHQDPLRLEARPSQIFDMEWYQRLTKEEEG